MSEQGAALQIYNQELVKEIETLKKKRCELLELIKEDEVKKAELEEEMASLGEKLSQVNDTLQERLRKKSSYDNVIESSEAAYMKILESSQVLLKVVRDKQDEISVDTLTISKE